MQVSFSPKLEAVPIGKFAADNHGLLEAFKVDPDKYEPVPIVSQPTDFEEDGRFQPILMKCLKENVHNCPYFSSLAQIENKTKFMHIFDLRCPPPLGRISEVEDIFGTVEIEDTKIVPGSFQENQMYRPVTTYGAPLLSKKMGEALMKAVEQGK